MSHDIKKKTVYLSGAIALTAMFFVVFVFGCIISFANAGTTMAHDMSAFGYAASAMNSHADDHMGITILPPKSPERGILFIALALLLASVSVLAGILLAHTIQTQLTWHMRKERILLFNPLISRFRTGIINPKIF